MMQHAKKYTLKLTCQSERARSTARKPTTFNCRMEPLEQQWPTLSKEKIQVTILLFSHYYSVLRYSVEDVNVFSYLISDVIQIVIDRCFRKLSFICYIFLAGSNLQYVPMTLKSLSWKTVR